MTSENKMLNVKHKKNALFLILTINSSEYKIQYTSTNYTIINHTTFLKQQNSFLNSIIIKCIIDYYQSYKLYFNANY